jgi:hypothetical protein
MADKFQDWLEDVPVLRDCGGRPAVEPVPEPVVGGLLRGVACRGLDTGGDVLTEFPELVADLGLGAAADRAAPALAVGAKPSDTDPTQ